MADQIAVVGGVDTHTDFHQTAVIDSIGRHLATAAFPTTPDGYRCLLEWLRAHGEVLAVGAEGTGAYGSELARFLRANEVTVMDVDRPDRKARRANGKSDPVDAYAAATAALSRRRAQTPGRAGRPGTGRVGRYRHRNGRPAADHRRRQSRPAEVRSLLRPSLRSIPDLRQLGTDQPTPPQPRWRPSGQPRTPHDRPRADALRPPHTEPFPTSFCAGGVGKGSSTRSSWCTRLILVGNPSTRSFVVPSSSAPQLSPPHHQAGKGSRLYVARRTVEGMPKKDILRCLQRFLAREVYKYLTSTKIPQNRLLQTA